MPHPSLSPSARRARSLAIALVSFAVGGVLLAQGLNAGSPVRDLLHTLLQDVRDPQWGILYVLMAFAIGTLVFAPVTVLFVATSLSVEAWRGFAYCLLGGLLSASLAYAAGRRLGGRLAARLKGRGFDLIRGQIAKHPVRAVLIGRFFPVGNFTLINLALGGFHVRFDAFLLGNVLGMLPSVLAITLGKELLESALQSPDWPHLSLLALGAAIIIATFYFVSKRFIDRRLALDAGEKPDDEPPSTNV